MKPQRQGELAQFNEDGWRKIQEDLTTLFYVLGGNIDKSNLAEKPGVQTVADTTPKKFATVAVTTSPTVHYTVQTGKYAVLKSIVVCSTTASAASVRIYAIPRGVTSAAASNAVFYDVRVQPREKIGENELWFVLNEGDRLAARASIVGLTLHYCGEEGNL